MSYNLKTKVKDPSFSLATAILFGADGQSGVPQPSVYDASVVSDALATEPKTLTNKTLDSPVVDDIRHASGGVLTVPNATGTIARLEDIGPGSGYTSPMVTRGQMLRRGASTDEAFRPSITGDTIVFDGTDVQFVRRGFANVTDKPYGALGDNSADDTAKIQACLNAEMSVRFGGPGYVFLVSDTLTVRSGQIIDLAGATIRMTASQKPMFNASGTTGVSIMLNGGTLQGHGNDYINSASSQAIGIKCESSTRLSVSGPGRLYNFCYSAIGSGTGASKSTDLRIEGCRIIGPGSAILSVPTGRNNAGIVAYADNAVIRNCIISDTGQGVTAAQQSTNIEILGNIIRDICVEHGMYLDSGIVGISVIGNIISNVTNNGIKLQYYDAIATQPQSVTIAGNIIAGTMTGDGIQINNSIPTGTDYRARACSVTGNVISGVAAGYGLNLRYLDGPTISGNTIYGSFAGMYLAKIESGTIAKNTMRFLDKAGILDAGTSNFLNIQGNQVYDWGRNYVTDEDRTAIVITGGAGHHIANNHLEGNTARAKYGVWVSGGTQSSMTVFGNKARGLSDYGVRLKSPKEAIMLCDQNMLEATTGGGSVLNMPDTVALLPTAAAAGPGGRRFVTDANAATFGSAVAGGGANKVPVVSDGTSWKIG